MILNPKIKSLHYFYHLNALILLIITTTATTTTTTTTTPFPIYFIPLQIIVNNTLIIVR